ncbi:methyl-CpG-binding domain protein 5-like isoform X2 [Anguilla anguilla]|uniref:methyl-CpG-binding domain protein 5-like isoform X2 n=1 Tax=Anguilla anguilla TaxID=7936 RepID=UPI0015A7C148|nr:methyl-CpG-binding domain protein 5-like isoform X2 [Anguilla anguilla]
MNGGKECGGGPGGGPGEGPPPAAQVPVGWKRRLDHSGVVYVSPSGSLLSCLEQVKAYLLTDGTCKCGLECPLLLHKVFNFNPRAVLKQRTAEDVKADEDVTKLCNHKRKIIAVATLHKKMNTIISNKCAAPMAPSRSATPRAIKSKEREGLSHPPGGLPRPAPSDCKNPFRALGSQRQGASELSLAQQQELYGGYARTRLGGAEHGQKSPYRMLSPASYGDGSPSPRADPLGSPDPFTRGNPGFHGTSSPSPIHGSGRMPLSPPGVLPRAAPSCALAGRTSVPLSPPIATQSPVMKNPACSFPPSVDMPRSVFHHKAPIPPAPGPHPHPQPPPPACTLQKKQLSCEKDPLGILDPIPSRPGSRSAVALTPGPPTFQPTVHSQVPVMNVVIPPAIVPLPSNLPLPTVKPGPVGHGGHGGHMQRLQHAATASVSPSPVTPPAHLAGSGVARVEASPQRSRSSSTSSDHGSFAMPPCGSVKVPPRSPRSSVGSPHPSLPSSPSAKPDPLQQYKDVPSQLLVGMSSSMFPPSSTGNGPQKGPSGLLGMPLNHILNRQNAASFPASSLLSAAAKAQLANQNKLTCGGGGNGGKGSKPRLAGSCGGVADGHSTLNPPACPANAGAPLSGSEGQSGRAALRDKLMAQQRNPLRLRKQLNGGGGGGVFMLQAHVSGPRHPDPGERLRTGARTGSLPPSASMAQLLQSMSNQSAPHPTPLQFGEGALHSGGHDSCRLFSETANQMQVTPRGSCRPLGHSPLDPPNPHPHGLTLHPQDPQGCRYILGRAHMGSPLPHCGDGGLSHTVLGQAHMGSPLPHCGDGGSSHTVLGQAHMGSPLPHCGDGGLSHTVLGQAHMGSPLPHCGDGGSSHTVLESGEALNCSVNNPKLRTLQAHNSGPMFQQVGQAQLGQGFQDPRAFPENPFPDSSSSSPMACLFQNFQVNVPESISNPSKQTSAQPRGSLRPDTVAMAALPQLQESLPELQPQGLGPPAGPHGLQGLPGGGGQSVDSIYRAVVDAASKGTPVVITTAMSGSTQASPVPALSAMSAFTASIGEAVSLPHAIHGADPPQRPHPQAAPPRNNSEQGKCTPEGGEAHKFFRSPSRGTLTPRRQWDEGGPGPGAGVDGHASWRGEEFLECSTQVQSSPHTERANTLAPTGSPPDHKHLPLALRPGDKAFLEEGFHFNSCRRASLNFKERLEQTVEHCAHMNGGGPLLSRGYGDILGPPRQDLMAEDQSPGSSTSLEGPLLKDYMHYNGHYNGCAPSPSDTKSLSSEEDLRQPDSPSSSELLHYRPRTFSMGELVWGQLKAFPPWPVKLINQDQVHNPGMQNSAQDKVEPGRLKTLTEDLEALNRATKRNRKGGKLNNHLEAAIHEAMSELDRMSGSVHQMPPRDRQIKPKTKRRKISR